VADQTAFEANLRALVAYERYRTPAKAAAALLHSGPTMLETELGFLDSAVQDVLRKQADDLTARGVLAISADDQRFPSTLKPKGRPVVPTLFCQGDLSLLTAAGAGMCGSRKATPLGLKAARACGEEVSARGLTVVSGYAKGVDTETHLAALDRGGTTVIVLAEGINHFRVKREFIKSFDPQRVLVVSQFHPAQAWASYGAMARNHVIFGLGRALVVIEAGEKGGTLAAGRDALKRGRPVFVLNFGEETPPGNRLLIDAGARAVSSRYDLGQALDAVDRGPEQGVLL
jgi:DNA processing protein